MFPDKLEIEGVTESDKSASYLDILLNIDSSSRLTTSSSDKRDDFDFAVVKLRLLCSIIPHSPAYGVHISQLMRCTRACFVYEDFSERLKLLTEKLMLQGYNECRLKSTFYKFYGHITTVFAITNYHWPICSMICFIQLVRLSFRYWFWRQVILYTWFGLRAHGGCDHSAEDTYSSAAPDPAFAFVEGPCCLTLDFVIAFWIIITFYTLLTSLFCI
jgi:hypothetical protein